MTTRNCSKCKVIKPATEFWQYKCKGRKGRLQCYCKQCTREYAKTNTTPEQLKRYQENRKLKYKTDPEYREKIVKGRQRYVLANKEVPLLCRAKIRARQNNIAFNIDLSDIIIPEYCPILGLKLNYNLIGKPRWDSPSLDRIDVNKGYVKGNVAVISNLANTMKNSATFDQLKAFADNIKKYIGDED